MEKILNKKKIIPVLNKYFEAVKSKWLNRGNNSFLCLVNKSIPLSIVAINCPLENANTNHGNPASK